MRRSATDPRPYPEPFSVAERAVIEHALVEGVANVKANSRLNLATCVETEINVELEAELNRMLNSPPKSNPAFSKALFETVVRGAELVNHNGEMPEKRPDLAFRSVRSLPNLSFPAQCVLLVECKIIDKKRPMSLYCGKGLLRFVDGTYSWAVCSAYMLGYTRGKGVKYVATTQLHKHFKTYGDRYELVGSLTRQPGSRTTQVYVSVHGRPSVPSLPAGPSGHISIRHLWLAIT